MRNEFLKKYDSKIQGVIGCYDRVVIKGTLHSVGHAGAMTNLLYRKEVALKDFSNFIAPYRNQLHQTSNALIKRLN